MNNINEKNGLTKATIASWIKEEKKFIISVTAAVSVTAAAASLLLPNIYTAKASALPPSSQQQGGTAAAIAALGAIGGLLGGSSKTPDELYVAILKSNKIIRTLDAKYNLRDRYNTKTYEELFKKIPRYIKITSEKKSSVITIEVDDEDPVFAAKLANTYFDELEKTLESLALTDAKKRLLFFKNQLEETKKNLATAEESLVNYSEKSGLLVLNAQAEQTIAALADLKSQIIQKEIQLNIIKNNSTAENPEYKGLKTALETLNKEYSKLDKSQTINGPEVSFSRLPKTGLTYLRAKREVTFQEDLFASILKQHEMARLDAAGEGPSIQIIDPAVPPDYKSKPSRSLIVLMAAFFSLMASSVWVIKKKSSLGYKS